MSLTALVWWLLLLTSSPTPGLTPTPIPPAPPLYATHLSPTSYALTTPKLTPLDLLSPPSPNLAQEYPRVMKREADPPPSPFSRPLSAPQAPHPVVHRLTALDCRHPIHQRTTPLSEACSTPDPAKREDSEKDTKDYVVIQRTSGHSRKAVRCQKLISEMREVCGNYGHSKLLTPPTILAPDTLTEEECQILVTNRLFQDEKRVMHAVSTDDYRYTSITHGSLHYTTNDVRCTGGGAIEINGRVMEDVVVLRETLLQIRHVTVTVDNDRIEDETTGELLPPACASETTCSVGKAVYVFSEAANPCMFSRIRVDEFNVYQTEKNGQIQNWARQDTHHLLFQLQEKVPAPATCQDIFAYSYPTQYQEIHLVEAQSVTDLEQIRTVEGYQVNLELEERTVDAYERHVLESELMNATRNMAKQLCLLARDSWTNELISPFNPRALLRVRGEILQELLCREVEVTAVEGDHIEEKCFHQALPVLKGGEHLLLRANTRLLVEPSALEETPCTRLSAPLFVVGTSILTADPEVRSVTLTMSQISLSALHPLSVDLQTSAFDDALLYTRAEMTSYLSLIHHKSAVHTITHALAREFCGRSGSCGSYSPTSGLLGFESLVNDLNPVGWFEEGLSKIREFGAYCSVIVVGYLVLSIMQGIFNFGRFCWHGYAFRDALQLALNPADLVARYADQVHQANRGQERDTA